MYFVALVVEENHSITLNCSTNSVLAPSNFSWTRTVNGSSVLVSIFANGGNLSFPNLLFDSVKWSDEGNYSCKVQNATGHTSVYFIQLIVKASMFKHSPKSSI